MSQSSKFDGAILDVDIPTPGGTLHGTLTVPQSALGVVLFAHGSGSGRMSPRNQFVAASLRSSGLATLLIDLLSEEEAIDRRKVFDIGLLADRLLAASHWLDSEPSTHQLVLGYFGASTGGGAALVAAAREPSRARAVVSRGGRPDLAREYLPAVEAATLLIVGGQDPQVLALNEQAFSKMKCQKELVVIPGATHLFPEAGALEEVSRLAEGWFLRYLGQSSTNPVR